MNTKHTPGPWTRINDLHPEVIGYANGSTYDPVCSLCPPGKLMEELEAKREANAHLIAAAPEMLEALKFVKSHLDKIELPYAEDIDNVIRAAIAKAEGRHE